MQASGWLGNPQSFWFDLENNPSYPFVFPDNHVRAASVCMMSCLQSLAVCICLNANLLKTSDRSISQSSRSSRSSSPSSSFLYCKRYKQTSFLPKTSRGFQLVAIHSMRFSSLLNNLNTSTYATMHGVNKVEKPYWQQCTMVAFECQFWKLPANHSPKTFSRCIESCCNTWCNSVLSQSLVLLSHHTGPEHK